LNKKFIFSNLRIKVMLLFVFLALAPLGLVGFFAIKTAEELILNMVKNQLENVAVDKAALLERWISERRADLEVVAGSAIIRSLNHDAIAPYLELVRDTYKVYSGFVVVSREGGISYASSPQKYDADGSAWFREARLGRPYMSDIAFDPLHQESFFLVAAPVLDDSGQVAGAVCAKVGTHVILSTVLRLVLGETGECYLVNREGAFLAHKEPGRILTENISQSESFKNILATENHRTTYTDYRGIEVIGASVKVGGTDWALVVEQDKDEAFAGAVRLKRYIFLAAAVSASGALILAWLLSHYLVNPIRQLGLAAGQLAQGEFDPAMFQTQRADEIGALYHAFGHMAEQLQARQQNLEQEMVQNRCELEETGAKLIMTQQAVARSQQLASLGRLASGVAHEIRTPLTSLKLFLESVESDIAISLDYEEDFRVAMGQIRRMEATINRFLDFARPQDPIFSLIEVPDLIEELLLVVGPIARKQETIIEKSLADHLPAIRGDRKQLGEALLNLMINSLEAMKQRGVLSITAGLDELPATSGRRRCIRIDVGDHGPGIPEENLARVFEPFFTTKATGAGLGLAIVARIAQRHGGVIHLNCLPGEGMVASLLIPTDGQEVEEREEGRGIREEG